MKEKFEPAYIIQIYHNKSDQATFAEAARVTDHKPGAFQPLTLDAMRDIFALSHEAKRAAYSKGILDPGLLSFSDRIEDKHVLWYRQAMQRTIVTEKFSYLVWMPAMLFYAKGSDLQLYSLKSNTRPTEFAPLFYAPVKNLTAGGVSFCWGSVEHEIKSTHINDIIKEWESYIWDSRFNNDGGSMIKSRDIYSLYKKLHESGKRFPKSELLTANLVLRDIFRVG